MPLRDYQELAKEQVRQHIRNGKRRICVVLPTGGGKSPIAADIIKGALAKGNPSLFWVHRRSLVTQMADRLRSEGLAVGEIMAGCPTGPEAIQVASILSLVRRDPPPARLILVDECHRIRGAAQEKMLERYPDAVLIGFTATPIRLDGRGLGTTFDAMVVAATPRELIDAGWLADYEGYRYEAPDISGVKVSKGDYDEHGLSLAYEAPSVIGDVVGRYLAHARGQQAILFASSIDNSKAFVAAFIAAGVRAEHIDHHTPLSERDAIMGRVRSGATELISNVGLCVEGVDYPGWRVAILARPSKSLTLYLQAVGRVLRPKPDGSKARIHDHAQLVATHGLPDIDRQWTLTIDKQKQKPPALHTCKQCFAVWQGVYKCPVCGWQPEVVQQLEEARRLEVIDGAELDIRSKTQVRRDELGTFEELMRHARAAGRKPGWAIWKFKEKAPGAPLPWSVWRRYVDKETKTWR